MRKWRETPFAHEANSSTGGKSAKARKWRKELARRNPASPQAVSWRNSGTEQNLEEDVHGASG